MQRLSLIALICLEPAALAKVNVILIHKRKLVCLIAVPSLGRKCVRRKVRGSLSHRPEESSFTLCKAKIH
jgi:hypothetical protein